MNTFALSAALAIGIGLGGAAEAADLLGRREVNYRSDRDVINVGFERPYRAIRVCVTRHAVRFSNLDVVYGNGGRHKFDVRKVIAKDECSNWFDLKGKARIIQRIELRYDTYGDSGPRAVVSVRGR